MSKIKPRPTQGRILLSALIIAILAAIILLSSPFSRITLHTTMTLTPSIGPGTAPFTATASDAVIGSTSTNTGSPPILTPGFDGTPTPINYPTAFEGALGINTPEGFDIVYWYTDYRECDINPRHTTFNIYGLIFSPGRPSYNYRFSFWRLDTVNNPLGFTATPSFTPQPTPTATPTVFPLSVTPYLVTPTLDTSLGTLGESVLFNQPVVLLKDRYYHVTISFDWENGIATWIDDLYYPGTKNDSRCVKPNH